MTVIVQITRFLWKSNHFTSCVSEMLVNVIFPLPGLLKHPCYMRTMWLTIEDQGVWERHFMKPAPHVWGRGAEATCDLKLHRRGMAERSCWPLPGFHARIGGDKTWYFLFHVWRVSIKCQNLKTSMVVIMLLELLGVGELNLIERFFQWNPLLKTTYISCLFSEGTH